MKKGIVLTAVVAAAAAAAFARASGLEEGFAAAQAAVAAAPKPAVCWTRGEDREADALGLPVTLCFARGARGFTAKPRAVFSNSYEETTCGESLSGAVEAAAGADGALVVSAWISSTNDACHSTPVERALVYVRR